jgi:hypothetical protein
MYDIVKFDMLQLEFLSHEKLLAGRERIVNITTGESFLSVTDHEDLRIRPALRVVSLLGAFASALAFIIVFVTSTRLAIVSMQHHVKNEQRKFFNPWKLDLQVDLVLFIVWMPGIFVLMASRAQIRIWTLMSGSSWPNLSKPCGPDTEGAFVENMKQFFYGRKGNSCEYPWDMITMLEYATSCLDIENACAFQYVAVWAFARLVISYFTLGNQSQHRTEEQMELQHISVDLATLEGGFDEVDGRRIPKVMDVTDRVNELIKENGAFKLTGGKSFTDCFLDKDLHKDFARDSFLKPHMTLTAIKDQYTSQIAESKFKQTLRIQTYNLSQLDAVADYYFSLKVAGMLGVWGYIIIGVIRSVSNVFFVFARERAHQDAAVIEYWNGVEDRAKGKIEPMFTFATILCICNMTVICKMKDIVLPSALGASSNLKFLATRGLLLVAQIQPNVLAQFTRRENDDHTITSPMQDKFENNPHTKELPPWLHYFLNNSISHYQAQLWHASLLGVWCLFFAAFNYVQWEKWLYNVNKFSRSALAEYEKDEMKKRLLGNDRASSSSSKSIA